MVVRLVLYIDLDWVSGSNGTNTRVCTKSYMGTILTEELGESKTTHRQTTGRHDNSATALFHRQPTRRHDHLPTRQVTDTFFKNSPTLADTHRQRLSRKRMKRNIFFNVNIALFSERTHHHFAFSKHKYIYMCHGVF